MKMLNKILLIIAWIISYLLPLDILTSEIGTCTQGSTDEYFTTMIYSSIILILFVIMIRRNYRVFYKLWWLVFFHIITIISYFYVIPKYLYYTTIQGISLCIVSSEFPNLKKIDLTKYSWQEVFSFEQRLFAPIITLILIVILFYSYKMIEYNFKKKEAPST